MKRTARVARCYTDQALKANSEVVLDKRCSHHLSTVLRARQGQAVQLFNGDGKNYQANITSTGKKTIVDIGECLDNDVESSLKITLVQAIARGDKMDGIIQKATELGVSCIQPIYTTLAISKLDASREERKRAHWQSIVISACEQSGRSRIPSIEPILNLKSYLDGCEQPASTEQRWVLSPAANPETNSTATERAKNNNTNSDAQASDITLLIGPESGFNSDEVELATTANFTPLLLGPRILRTETAGPASIAIFQARFGDMK